MLRAPLLCLAILAAAWLEFHFFPGHTYLEGDTQLYVPMLERVDSPGLLARDLVATNPNISFTAYDEIAVFLHQTARLPFRRALLAQHFVLRIAALLGVFLLARATGLGHLFAFAVAAIVNLGATLTEREPTPSAFGFAATLLAMGLLAQKKPLMAGVVGGIAFLYDPVLALPFWVVTLVGFVVGGDLRNLVRPMLPIFLVFGLLLANLAQLQPGAGSEPLFHRASGQLIAFQAEYTPNLLVGAWPKGEILQVLALFVLGLWAALRCGPLLSGTVRWLLLGVSLCGVLSIPFSFLVLDQMHSAFAARLQPARMVVFIAAASALLFGLAGMRAVRRNYRWEALAWFSLLFMLSIGNGVFEFIRLSDGRHLSQFAMAIALAALLTGLLLGFAFGSARFVVLAAPLAAVLALTTLPGLQAPPIPFRKSISELAAWAENSTWGSSVFLFPDAGRAAYPGAFRAESRHALWVDWMSRRGLGYAESGAMRWQERWQTSMESGFSPPKLETLLPLPIDYYVLKRQHQLANARYVFANRDFVVYDAQDLRGTVKPLRLGK